jgi:hypothetical protein
MMQRELPPICPHRELKEGRARISEFGEVHPNARFIEGKRPGTSLVNELAFLVRHKRDQCRGS